MRTWLAAAAAASLAASFAAHAQSNRVQSPAAANPDAASNFALPAIPAFDAQSPFQDGIIAEEEVAPNAHLDLGLAHMLGRNMHSVMIEKEQVPTRNPGVTFVVKFRG